MEEAEFDQKGAGENGGTEAMAEVNGCGNSASRGEEVVDNDHPSAGLEGVGVHFQRCGSVFQIVVGRNRMGRKFAFFSDENDASAQGVGKSAPENKSSGVYGHDGVGFLGTEGVGHQVNKIPESAGVGANRGDVLENDAGFGEIRHVANAACVAWE